ncbi:glycosyltransferase family 2 protein [Chloroflexota bacterium]
MSTTHLPRITFGMIILNGMPFVPYNLRALYPFAHQIVVVEGAAPAAKINATPTGHSTDGTLEELRRFKAEEDPEDKLIIVTAENEGHSDGFWPGEKDEMSQAYARRATGDWLWQVDSDEFYLAEDMHTVCRMLSDTPTISAMTFDQITFFGSPNYWVDGWHLRSGATYFHRLFRWGAGYTYAAHRPPTVLDENGVDTRSKQWVTGQQTAKMGLRMYHYSLLFPFQVADKCRYYDQTDWNNRTEFQQWYKKDYMQLQHPYRLHNVYQYPGWINHFTGKIPTQINQMMADIKAGQHNVALRQTDDIEKLLTQPSYAISKQLLAIASYPVSGWLNLRPQLGKVKRALGITYKFFQE